MSTLCKLDTSLRWTAEAGPDSVRLRESWLYAYKTQIMNAFVNVIANDNEQQQQQQFYYYYLYKKMYGSLPRK